MKKISIILACVIVAICMAIPTMVAGNSGNTVTAEATEEVVAVSAAKVTTEATTEKQESKTTKKSSKSTTKQTFKPYNRYVKGDTVNIRNNPSKKGKVVAKYHNGKTIKIIGSQGDWRKIGKNKWIHKSCISKKDPCKYYKKVKLQYSKPYNITSKKLTRSKGVNRYNGHRETWYSTHESGQTVTAYHIPGKHVAKDGTIRDKDGFICVAASSRYGKGATFMTSLGPAKVYDRGVSGSTVDIYTTW